MVAKKKRYERGNQRR